jgi:hypothetical protein
VLGLWSWGDRVFCQAEYVEALGVGLKGRMWADGCSTYSVNNILVEGRS